MDKKNSFFDRVKKEHLERKETSAKLAEEKLIEEEIKRKEEEEIAESKKIKVPLTQPQFTQVCKAGFLSTQEKNGRADITFSSNDILTLCRGSFIEKQGLDETYKFGIMNISSYEIREIVKRSPMFSGIAELI